MSKIQIITIIIIACLAVLYNSLFIVNEKQVALVLQFGEAVNQISQPGLHVKAPFIQNVLFFDQRIHNLNADTSEVIALDQKTMRVDAFAKYQITDVLKFYQTAQNDRNFKLRLDTILDSSLRQVLGSVPFIALLSSKRDNVMKEIRHITNDKAQHFGVEVLDVRIMRADLPDSSREAVYKRMRTEREKEAKEIRSTGMEAALKIQAKADKDKAILMADAEKQADIIKGEGQAVAIKTFAAAFSRDPEFFDFYKSLEVYKNTFDKDSTKMLMSPDNQFMKHFHKGN